MAITTYGDISQRTAAWAAVKMLEHAEPINVLSKFGDSKPVPRNKANQVKFRRPIPLTISTTALSEGVTPASQQMQYADVSVTLAQYGGIVEITDVVNDLSEDPVLRDAAELSGEQAAETIENLIWNVVRAGTNVTYTNGSARSSVNTVFDLNDIRSAVRTLKNNRGRPINQILSGSPDYGTTPVEGGYVAIGHTDIEADVRNTAGFIPVAEYGQRKPLCPEECGTVENVRFVLSPVLTSWADSGGTASTYTTKSTTGTSSDVYPILVCAKHAFGLVPLKGEGAITPSVLNPGTVSKSDPLGQRGYVGWKTYFAAVRLNETWMVRIETAVSDI